MRKILTAVTVVIVLLAAGCSTGKKQQVPVSLQNGQKTQSKSYFARERERKQRYEKEFRDTSRPMNQDHFKVMPWHGPQYSPRSERLHDNTSDSLFRF